MMSALGLVERADPDAACTVHAVCYPEFVALFRIDRPLEDARIVVGAMGRAPLLLAKSAAMLVGKPLNDTDAFKSAADAAMDSAAAFAVHNVGSTVEYRSAMVSQMVYQALSSVI